MNVFEELLMSLLRNNFSNLDEKTEKEPQKVVKLHKLAKGRQMFSSSESLEKKVNPLQV